MKKIHRPQRAKRGGKSIGNYFIKPDGVQINLGTKDAGEALARSREYTRTGRKNFTDDLDGAAQATVAAVEGAAAPGESVAPPIAQPPPAQPTPPAAVAAPVPSVPAAAPIPEAAGAPPPPSTPTASTPPPEQPAGAPPVNADWRDDAREAAEKTATAADAAAPKPAMQLDPNMIEQFVKTGGTFLFGAQLWMQGKIVEWGVGEKPPALFPTMERMHKAGQLPDEHWDNAKMVKDLSIAGYGAFIRRKLDLERLPDWAVGLIAAGSFGTVQWSMAAVTKEQKKRAKNGERTGAATEPLGMPKGTPAAPPPVGETSENGAGAEAM